MPPNSAVGMNWMQLKPSEEMCSSFSVVAAKARSGAESSSKHLLIYLSFHCFSLIFN